MYIAEILIDHPTLTVFDQVDTLAKQQVIRFTDCHALHLAIAAARPGFDDPQPGTLPLTLADGRRLCVRKYVPPPQGQAGQRVQVMKREFATVDEEIWYHIRQLQMKNPDLTDDAAQRQVMAEHPDLWEQHTQAQRAGRAQPAPVAKQAPPTVEAILKEAQAAAEGTTTRAVLVAWAQTHPGEAVYTNAHRTWHLSGEGMREHYVQDKGQG